MPMKKVYAKIIPFGSLGSAPAIIKNPWEEKNAFFLLFFISFYTLHLLFHSSILDLINVLVIQLTYTLAGLYKTYSIPWWTGYLKFSPRLQSTILSGTSL